MKPEALKSGKETIDNIKTDLDKYLFQDLMDGEEVDDGVSTKKVAVIIRIEAKCRGFSEDFRQTRHHDETKKDKADRVHGDFLFPFHF